MSDKLKAIAAEPAEEAQEQEPRVNQSEIEKWLAIRKEEGRKIDPETAEVKWDYAATGDPYRIRSPIHTHYFARSRGSDIWVWFGDLPDATRDALWGKKPVKSPDQINQEWLATRKEAGPKIDPETAEVMWVYAQTLDPYGIDPELPPELEQVGREYFARSPGSDVWVLFDDLPRNVRDALWTKHKRELAFMLLPRDPFSKDKPASVEEF